MTRVKICGITSEADARMAADAGAHAIGLLVGQRHASLDFVEIDTAASICAAAPPLLHTVVVTHLKETDEILALARRIGFHSIQLHSELSPAHLAELRAELRPRQVLGLVSVRDTSAVDRALAICDAVDAIVLDSIDESSGQVGGTGRRHDWSVSATIVQECSVPVVLAGGLSPDNVVEAIERVRPWAVDVNSGVKNEHGGKSEAKVRAFLHAVSGAQSM